MKMSQLRIFLYFSLFIFQGGGGGWAWASDARLLVHYVDRNEYV